MTKDYANMSNEEFHKAMDTTDAMIWAKAFCQITKAKQPELDESYMVSWFANSMMKVYDKNMWDLGKLRRKLENCEAFEKECARLGLEVTIKNSQGKFRANIPEPIIYRFKSKADMNYFKLTNSSLDLTDIFLAY